MKKLKLFKNDFTILFVEITPSSAKVIQEKEQVYFGGK